MNATATLGRILALLARDSSSPVALDGFLDSLLQKFENCRPGVPTEVAASGSGSDGATRFFTELYEAECPRLREIIRQEEPLLTDAGRAGFFRKVDDLVRNVVLPAYVRLALPYTARERNDFYFFPAPFHLAERILWGLGGILLGVLVIEAPFIPLWSKEWIFPAMVAGLLFPNLRRFLSMRRFERELNQQVGRADREIARIDTAYLINGETESVPALELGASRLATPPKAAIKEGAG